MHKLYLIIGCTASGKGSLGRELARRLGGQIVSVDSMKIYRRMDIGTAKPSPAVRAQIPHHCIDLAEPSESFSVAQFVEHATVPSAKSSPRARMPGRSEARACTSRPFPRPVRGPISRRGNPTRSPGPRRVRRPGPPARGAGGRRPRRGREDTPQRREADRPSPGGLPPHGHADNGASATVGQRRRRYEAVFIGLRRDKADQARRINLRRRSCATPAWRTKWPPCWPSRRA